MEALGAGNGKADCSKSEKVSLTRIGFIVPWGWRVLDG